MAKALLGHVGNGADLRLVAEVRRLRARVVELESDLSLAHEQLAATITVEDDLSTLHAPAFS